MKETEKKALALVGLCIIFVFVIAIFVIQISVSNKIDNKVANEDPLIEEMQVEEGRGSEKYDKVRAKAKNVMSVAEADAHTMQNKLDQTNSEEINADDYNWIERLYDNNPILRPYITVFYKSGGMITEVENRIVWNLYQEKVTQPRDEEKLRQAKKELEELKNKLGTKLQEN